MSWSRRHPMRAPNSSDRWSPKRIAAGTVGVLVVAALATSSLTAASANDQVGGDPAKTIPTLPTTTTIATGIDIPSGAGIAQMTAIVTPILGPTADIAAELSRLADLPAGILSPAGAEIESFRVDYFGADERYVAAVTFTSDATPEDLVVFYQTTLTASGFVPTIDDDPADAGGPTRRLGFDNPNSIYDSASVEVRVTDGEVDHVMLTITDHADPEALSAFSRWAQGMPTIDQGSPVDAGIATLRTPDGRLLVTVSTRFGYDDRSAADLGTQIRRALRDGVPDGGFRIDEVDDRGGEAIALQHILMLSVSATVGAGVSHRATLWISGSFRI